MERPSPPSSTADGTRRRSDTTLTTGRPARRRAPSLERRVLSTPRPPARRSPPSKPRSCCSPASTTSTALRRRWPSSRPSSPTPRSAYSPERATTPGSTTPTPSARSSRTSSSPSEVGIAPDHHPQVKRPACELSPVRRYLARTTYRGGPAFAVFCLVASSPDAATDGFHHRLSGADEAGGLLRRGDRAPHQGQKQHGALGRHRPRLDRVGLPTGGRLPRPTLARRRTPQAVPSRLRSGRDRARAAPRHRTRRDTAEGLHRARRLRLAGLHRPD